jgi:hypothetical protein
MFDTEAKPGFKIAIARMVDTLERDHPIIAIRPQGRSDRRE